MKIVVLAGGLSSERNVSLVTGTYVCRALKQLGHQAVLVDMFLGLENYNGTIKEIFNISDGLYKEVPISQEAPDLMDVRNSRKDKSDSLFGPGVLDICKLADIVFLGLHGACGEDGRVQAAFDLLGIPYTGAGYLSSAMAMDKAITKKAMEYAGIPTAPWRELYYTEDDISNLVNELEVPCAVKVVNGGSSLGVSLPDTKEELRDALKEMLHYGNHVIVEKKISGRELTVGVLGDQYLPAVEIIPNKDFRYFDYTAKYQVDGSLEICPADITDAQWKEMGEYTLRLYRELGLSTYSRADFILDENGQLWCLEINTLPGLTPASLFPKEAAAFGLTYGELCEKIINLSLEARNKELKQWHENI